MVMDEVAELLGERVLSDGGRGRLRQVEYGFAGGVRQAFDVFDVRATMQGSAGVVAVDDEGYVHLVREFLPALGKWGLTIPRGGIEVGETPELAAARELKEEAGLACAALVPLWQGVVLPNVSSWRVTLFLGQGVRPCVREGGDELSAMETVRLPMDEACAMAAVGAMPGALTSLALMLARARMVGI